MTPKASYLESTAPAADPFDKPYRIELCPPEESADLAELLEEGKLDELRKSLGEAELALAGTLKTPKRRREWLAARLASKRLLNWVLQQEGLYLRPREIEILNREDGSPRVFLRGKDAYEHCSLSISHSAGWGAAAVARPGALVGVDLETVEPRPAGFLSLMAHDSEWDASMDGDLEEQTRLWTLKEAVSKLLRTGFSIGFWDVRFPLQGDARRLELHGKALASWEALGKPVIHFDSESREDSVLSIAYTAGVPHNPNERRHAGAPPRQEGKHA